MSGQVIKAGDQVVVFSWRGDEIACGFVELMSGYSAYVRLWDGAGTGDARWTSTLVLEHRQTRPQLMVKNYLRAKNPDHRLRVLAQNAVEQEAERAYYALGGVLENTDR